MHVTTGRHFDSSRNSSHRGEVPPGAADDVLEHLAAHRRDAWYRWIVDGRPELSEAEYAACRGKSSASSTSPAPIAELADRLADDDCQLPLDAA
jgi:hypothetical protein